MSSVVLLALRQRVLVAVLLAVFMVMGVVLFTKLNIEAYPDPVPPQVEIVTQSSGLSAEEIERNISIPIEIQMAGIPHITAIRTISLFGLSDVKVQFTYDFTYDEAQQWVINRLSQLPPLPGGVQPQLSPTSPIGEIYRYRLMGPPGYSVTDLKTIQDWILERRFKAVPGVVDVTGWGGKTKTYEVSVDQHKLLQYGVTIPQLLTALNNSNVNVGGQTVNIGQQAAIVRGVGLIRSASDIGNVVLAQNKGVSVMLHDVADVSIGHQPRLGIAGQDNDDDIVQGIVLMRRGEQSMPTIHAVEDEVRNINASGILPAGVYIKPIYDRTDLINVTTRTVLENMLVGMVLIFLVQWLFLGDLRSAAIASATIPFALLFAVTILMLRGESANLLSVGAIDFGLVVDATVIMVENIFRHLSGEVSARGEREKRRAEAEAAGMHGKLATIMVAAQEVGQSILFSAAIIVAAFVPLFTMSGVEGHIFGPMARTYAYAIAGGVIATFVITPVLSAFLLPEKMEETETRLLRFLHHRYVQMSEFALANRTLALGGAGVLLGFAILAVTMMGMEFLPHLEEGNFWIRATMPQAVSLEASDQTVNEIRKVLLRYPEVQTVVSQHGRPDDGTDATGYFNAEFFAPLKTFDDHSVWKGDLDTKDKLVAEMNKKLQDRFPGVEFNFSQYIQDNVEEAASGVKGENSIKLYGSDLATLQATAMKIENAMAKVPGITDLGVFDSMGQPTLNITVDRNRAARYGLNSGDINSVIQAAVGGAQAGSYFEPGTDRNYPIMVRLADKDRQDITALGRIPVTGTSPTGATISVPLSDVADIKLVSGASFIYREGGERYIPIKFSVRGRDLASAVKEAQQVVDHDVALPTGYHVEWAGELGDLNEALGRLAIVVPISIGLILILLFLNFSSLIDMLLAAAAMPLAMVGGVIALLVTHTPFSISAAIGFVALLGISVMDGILIVSTFNQAIDEGLTRSRALKQTYTHCLRPVIMTCFVAFVGLLPASISNGVGSQVQKPLALVVVGGAFLAPFLILTVLPTLVEMFSRHVSRFKYPTSAPSHPTTAPESATAHEMEVTAE